MAMRHRLIAPLLAALAILALASITLAGGWAEVTVKDAPVGPPAGGQTTLNLNVLQHGVTPVSWPNLTVIATDAESGAIVRTQAQAKGPEGSYVATIVFPNAGEWTLTFDSPELDMTGSSVAMNVAPAAVAAGVTAAAPVASTFDPTPLLLLLIAAAVALVIVALAMRNRGKSTGERVTVRT
jgi:hypothetical protein